MGGFTRPTEMCPLKLSALVIILATTEIYALPTDSFKEKRAIGIFNVVSFPNTVCISSSNSRNGTCYTGEECASRDGVASGSCADGFGVCCIISIGCGATSTENCTYLVQDSSTTPNVSPENGNGCTYKICPSDSSINRIRLDLSIFQIAGPGRAGDFDGVPNGIPVNTAARLYGRCIQDTFTVTGTRGPYPTICGTNSGQHMIVDTDGTTCVEARFSYGATATRMYTIHVTQYAFNNEMGGPPGCLQFYTGETGTAESFNYEGTTGARAANPGQHLQSHDYNVCVRPLAGRCIICWGTTVSGNVNAMRGSFGLSVSAAAALSQAVAGEAACLTDYVEILGGIVSAAAPANLAAFGAGNTQMGVDRFCGRFFAANAGVADTSVCTRQAPFSLRVNLNDNEATANQAQNMADMNEYADGAAAMATAPFGSMGFSLSFQQVTC